MFDHKSVSLSLGPPEPNNNLKTKTQKLRNSGLSDPILLHKVNIAAYKSHLFSLDTRHSCNILGPLGIFKGNTLETVRQIENKLKEYIELRTIESKGGGGSVLLAMQLSEINSEILQMFDDLVGLTQLGSLPKN